MDKLTKEAIKEFDYKFPSASETTDELMVIEYKFGHKLKEWIVKQLSKAYKKGLEEGRK